MMKSYRIGFTRIENRQLIEDETEFDIVAGDEIALMLLFSDFCRENDFTIYTIDDVTEVPYDGEQED